MYDPPHDCKGKAVEREDKTELLHYLRISARSRYVTPYLQDQRTHNKKISIGNRRRLNMSGTRSMTASDYANPVNALGAC